jgi:hypothetical protein
MLRPTYCVTTEPQDIPHVASEIARVYAWTLCTGWFVEHLGKEFLLLNVSSCEDAVQEYAVFQMLSDWRGDGCGPVEAEMIDSLTVWGKTTALDFERLIYQCIARPCDLYTGPTHHFWLERPGAHGRSAGESCPYCD